jgi:hypothetical protein
MNDKRDQRAVSPRLSNKKAKRIKESELGRTTMTDFLRKCVPTFSFEKLSAHPIYERIINVPYML